MSEEKKYLEQYYKETDPMKRKELLEQSIACLLYTSPSPRDTR